MLVHEKINEILKQKNITKKEFADKLLNLNPILKSTGELPSKSTIYNFLSGVREIKADMIPYIASALDVYEQELFFEDEKSIVKFYQNILSNEISANYFVSSKSEKIQSLINLCEYAPNPLIDRIVTILEKNKTQVLANIKQIY